MTISRQTEHKRRKRQRASRSKEFPHTLRTERPYARAAIAHAAFSRVRSTRISAARRFSPNRPLDRVKPGGFQTDLTLRPASTIETRCCFNCPLQHRPQISPLGFGPARTTPPNPSEFGDYRRVATASFVDPSRTLRRARNAVVCRCRRRFA